MGFKIAFTRLAPLFAGLTLCMYVYVWLRYPGVLSFLPQLFPHQAPLLAAHAYTAFVLTLPRAEGYVSDTEDLDEYLLDEYLEELTLVNPGSGLPMVGGMGGVDVAGNTWGSDSDD